jgi:hypothetical protein
MEDNEEIKKYGILNFNVVELNNTGVENLVILFYK